MALLACDVGPGDEVITTPATWISTSLGHQLRRRPAGLRGRRSRSPTPSIRTWSSGPSRRGRGPFCRSTCTARRPTSAGCADLADGTGSSSSRTPPSARGHVARPARRLLRPGRLFQFLPRQEPRRLRRGRLRRDRRRRHRPAHPQAARPRPAGPAPSRRDRLQHPHGRHPGRRARRQAASPRRAGTPPGPATPASTGNCSPTFPGWRCPLLAGGRARLAPVRRHVGGPAAREGLPGPCPQGIATGIHYPTPVPFQPAYAHLGYRRGDFPVAEHLMANCLSLPMFPELTPDRSNTRRLPCARCSTWCACNPRPERIS